MTLNDQTVRHYVFNLETTKIELHFDKADYDALTNEQRNEIKSAFLWSKWGKCWVSRAKEPNLHRAKQIAHKLGFTDEQREGERLTYAEQVQRQAERAEERANRYDGYAHNAEERAGQLQKPLNGMRGDIAFFTQPIIAGHSGSQSFARRREQMYRQYEKGFEEYRKSEYFKSKAAIARGTASQAQFDNPAYLDRRIKECKKEIRDREKNVIYYEKILCAVESGEEKKWRGGEVVTVEEVRSLIEREFELIEKAMDKQAYLENCLEELGGIRFSKDNIRPGYIVRIGHRDQVEIISTGPQNVIYKILAGGAAGMTLKAAYAEISEIVKIVEGRRAAHPFKVGEKFEGTHRTYELVENSLKSTTTKVIYEIVKASETTIQLKPIDTDEKPITRKPSQRFGGQWAFSIDDTYGNTFYKEDGAR